MDKKFFTKAKGIDGKIKRRYSDFVVEEMTTDGKKCAVEFLLNGKKEFEKLSLPENGKDFLLLEMEKKNIETNLAVKKIARFMHTSQKSIGYAGLKDKRAITCQRISIYKPKKERIENFSMQGLVLKNPCFSDKGIDLGELKGNYFTITIRDIDLEEREIIERVKTAFNEIKKGIPNYFGQQRFGGIRQISHLVGKEIIKGNIENAVMLYLTAQSEKEEPEVKKARLHLIQTLNFKQAEKEFPLKYRYERAMAHYLASNKRDFFGAFNLLPRRLRFLFTHAYQSYLFNKILQKRIENQLLEAIEGEPQEDGIPLGLIPGFNSKYSPGKIGEIEREILEKEGISFPDFKVKKIKECSCQGARRKILFKPKELKLIETGKDEFFDGKNYCKISFFLEKGVYATVLLDELMKQTET